MFLSNSSHGAPFLASSCNALLASPLPASLLSGDLAFDTQLTRKSAEQGPTESARRQCHIAGEPIGFISTCEPSCRLAATSPANFSAFADGAFAPGGYSTTRSVLCVEEDEAEACEDSRPGRSRSPASDDDAASEANPRQQHCGTSSTGATTGPDAGRADQVPTGKRTRRTTAEATTAQPRMALCEGKARNRGVRNRRKRGGGGVQLRDRDGA
mmetsp:Transcript_40450/g.129941  ORF Transcript_40450/g.129941 Transcript_40450/m.129941 type:complete len:213 (-) Transcript_40450:2-640(-)